MHITADGIDAQEIQLQKTATEIQWKRTGDTTWKTLVALSAIKGDTGATGKEGMSVTGATINTEGELILTIDYRA